MSGVLRKNHGTTIETLFEHWVEDINFMISNLDLKFVEINGNPQYYAESLRN